MLENLKEIPVSDLLSEVQHMQSEGYRFVTASCVDNQNDTFDMLYHFDLNSQITNYRVIVNKDEAVPSVSKIYFCAVLVENEIKELFGVNITDMEIDYGGRFLLAEGASQTPMAGGQIMVIRK